MDSLDFLVNVFLSLALGGLIGLERESSGKPWVGVRSFALLALFGLVVWVAGGSFGVLIGLGGVLLLAAYYYKSKVGSTYAHGVTTTLMLPLVFLLGVLVGFGKGFEAVVAAIASTFLLVEKKKVHDLVRGVSRQEIIDLLVFALLAFIIFPILPKQDVVLAGVALSPTFFWGVIVVVDGIGLFGNVATKYFHKKGFELAVFFSGVVSSLAAVTVFARENKDPAALNFVFGLAFLGALVGDVALLSFTVPAMLLELFPLFALLALGCSCIIFFSLKKVQRVDFMPKALSLGFAFEFALVFLLVSIFLTPFFSSPTGWLAAFIGGLVNSTAVIAASALSFKGEPAVVLNVFFAVMGSTSAKAAVIFWNTRNAKQLVMPVAVMLAAGVVGVWLSGVF